MAIQAKGDPRGRLQKGGIEGHTLYDVTGNVSRAAFFFMTPPQLSTPQPPATCKALSTPPGAQ